MTAFRSVLKRMDGRACLIVQFSSLHFSSRWYLSARKIPYALRPVSQKFPQRRLWNGPSVSLIDDGPLSSFQWRLSHKVKSGTGSTDWNVSMVDINFRKLLWVYCPGHIAVKGNDPANTLVGKTTLTSGLLLRRSGKLRSLRHYLRAQSQGHHTIDRLEERSVERESARRSSFKGRERVSANQTNIQTILKATLGKLLRDVVERIWTFLSA